MASVVIEERLHIPLGLSSLDEFRAWSRSDDFPESGRIDYIGGNVEVDMSPEDLFTHGSLKVELAAVLLERVKRLNLGYLFCDRSRVSHPEANLSVEPDLVLVTRAAIESGHVTFFPKAGERPDRYIEIVGAPELIVEIVSDNSVGKDTRRLRAAYHAAGVAEYWLVDARGEQLSFQINVRSAAGYQPASADAEGFQYSAVLNCGYQMQRCRDELGHWTYTVETKPR